MRHSVVTFFFQISGEFAKFKATIGYMEMGGDDHDKDGKHSFDEFKTVVESNLGSDFVFNIFSRTDKYLDRKAVLCSITCKCYTKWPFSIWQNQCFGQFHHSRIQVLQ